MYTAPVEIFSDQTNAAVMRHPGRKYPGVLVQGDTLFTLCAAAEACSKRLRGKIDDVDSTELHKLRDHLRSLVNHYVSVLVEHNISPPFSDTSNV